MKYSVMVEYALHSLVYLIQPKNNEAIGIKELSEFQGLSETYLSKVFTKLTKSEIVSSVPGVNGGYRLAKSPEQISFWDVIKSVEGVKPIFQCKNILKHNKLYLDDEKCQECDTNHSCSINLVMLEAENQMKRYLKEKTLAWLYTELEHTLPQDKLEGASQYFSKK